MKTFATLLKNELKLNIRDMNMVVFAVILPFAILVILGMIYGTRPAFNGVEYTFMDQSVSAVCAISICAGGLMVGGIAKNAKAASVIASALYFPMLIFSGTTLPLEIMPEGIRKIVVIFPLTHGIQLMKAASLGLPVDNMRLSVAVMAAVTVICTTAAVKCFKWE